MATQAQIERAARALIAAEGAADIFMCTPANEVDRLTLGMQAGAWCAKALAALTAGRPNPEEHERGIWAAVKIFRNLEVSVSSDPRVVFYEPVKDIIEAYLAAAGGE